MGVKNWKPAGNFSAGELELIQHKYSLPRPIAVYFAARGIDAAAIPGFLDPRLANLSDPYRFPQIKEACARLWQAIENREPILIHGDYDTDGITASALLALVLRQNGAVVNSFIPTVLMTVTDSLRNLCRRLWKCSGPAECWSP